MRFVVLHHQGICQPHFDLMLEIPDGSLRTWRIVQPPGRECQDAVMIADHRLAYLSYEGPIAGSRGWVKRWDRGTYRPLEMTEIDVRTFFAGSKLNGMLELSCVEAPSAWCCNFTNRSGRSA